MKEYQIAVIAGDGIGPDVMAQGRKVFRSVGMRILSARGPDDAGKRHGYVAGV